MQDQKQKFLCCTRKQIAISRCPSCNYMFGYCRVCSTLFTNLQDLAATSAIPRGTELACSNCQFIFPLAEISKYLVTAQDLKDAGLAALISEDLRLKKNGSEEVGTTSDSSTSKVRCSKCGNEVQANAMKCPKCGLPTPLGRTGGLKSPTRKLEKPTSSRFLPKFLTDSPLSKVTIPPKLGAAVAIGFPLLVVAFYLFSVSQFCLTCAQVGGKYTTDLSLDNKRVRAELMLYQYGSVVTGQVLFTPLLDPSTNPNPPATQNPKLPPKPFVETIQSGRVQNKNVSFETYVRDGNSPRVKFTGQLNEENILKGDLQVAMPEFDWVGKTFSITVKKS